VPRGLALLALLSLVAGAGVPAPVAAQPIEPRELPPELRPWVPWVLDTVPGYGCPRVQGRPVCVWPGRLRLELDGRGGRFSLDFRADRESDLPLPGTKERWPLDVSLDGRAAPVFERSGVPSLRVPPGRHRVGGRFAWSRLPESLGVPPSIGLLELALDGRPVPRPRREKAGLLWLRARGDESAGDGESLRLQVFRHVADGIPLFVQTRLQLEVSGRSREVTFPEALLPDSVPVAVSGDLPARVEDGALRVQLRGGRYSVSVDARVEGRPEELHRPPAAEEGAGPGALAWPDREVWVFAADETLRQVELSGPAAIDPSRTELPSEWAHLPAFLVEPDDRLTIRTVRRGQPEAAPDALSLFREMWLAPDGQEATVHDSFSGTLHGTTRLDLLAPGDLGRVAVDGQDQLVTTTEGSDAAGVELRRSALRLEADSRLPLDGALPAVGWSTPVEQLGIRLHLPPGWSLLASRGVDQAVGTWTSRWTLLGFFFVLLVAFGAYRLFGPRHAALAVITLVLTYGEPGAPFLLWLSLLGAIALRRVAPEGRLGSLGRIWFLVSAALIVLLLVPFARDQIKTALFPQVARVGVPAGRAVAPGALADKVSPMANVPAAPPVPEKAVGRAEGAEEEVRARAEALLQETTEPARQASAGLERYASYNVALQQDPKAVLQTGPGLPSWTWQTHALTWTGPVGPDHRLRLVLASPGLNRLLTLGRLLALGLFTWVLLTGRGPRLPRRGLLAGGAAAALLLLATAARPEERATPTPQLLEELKQRLTRPAPCAPACVSAPDLRLRLNESRLSVEAEVHAAAAGSWPLPGPLASWAPSEVLVDGAPAVALAHLRDGFLHVRLSSGVHRVEASGPVPPGDSFTLQFAQPPHRARAEAPAWDVTGLRSDGPPDASILLARRLARPSGPQRTEGSYAPWLEVRRTLGFGVSWTVETRVRRVTPRGTPVAVRVPLLAGEAPTRADLVVDGGEVAVSLGRDEVETHWQSTLEQAAHVTLHAPEGRPWSEVWRLQCSTVWSCAATGLPPVSRVSDGVFEPEYRPWPGESLDVALDHPSGVEGQTLTLDSVQLDATPGSRLERVQLSLQARSSREQPLRLRLSETAEMQQVLVDGRERPLRPEAGELSVTIPTGRHAVEARWQETRGTGFVYSLPRVGLPGPAVNVTQQLTLPPSRWLLLTWGPSWGPAVLFWPYLLFLLAVSWALGRLRWSPLTSLQWVLLGLGLSQIPALGALVVAGFVFALALRKERQPGGSFLFDIMQLGLVAWAAVTLVLLYVAIHTGLLFRPDMQVAGNGSSNTVLRWYADRVQGETPPAGVLSLPLWVYRVGMLVWALWLAVGLVRAVAWGWRVFGTGGFWRRLVRRRVSEPTEARPDTEGPPRDDGETKQTPS
jgi:hypothetical protein